MHYDEECARGIIVTIVIITIERRFGNMWWGERSVWIVEVPEDVVL